MDFLDLASEKCNASIINKKAHGNGNFLKEANIKRKHLKIEVLKKKWRLWKGFSFCEKNVLESGSFKAERRRKMRSKQICLSFTNTVFGKKMS